ncbi:MAG TPA: diguanylate cyclase [Terracidiphilus sp.]|nr:diguanylate cyclase [Terracidiphilus sp.]
MISLKKYLEESPTQRIRRGKIDAGDLLPVALAAYCSTLREMASAGVDACPILGEELKRGLGKIDDRISAATSSEDLAAAERDIQAQLREWGRGTASHYRQKADEVKEILLVMARTAEGVGERDQRCASQITEVTGRLEKMATLEDLSQIRTSLKKSATELKTSIERMTAEGKAAIEKLKTEVTRYQTRLEEAERVASSDALTGLRNRLWAENYIERRIGSAAPFCIVIADIDEFKQVNDEHGHPAGDELLQQFSTEMQSACRPKGMVARWGGDEFMVLLDCNFNEAQAQIQRLKDWVCGNYTIHGRSGPEKLKVDASFGLAEREANETAKSLLARADADMYAQKAASRARR